MNAISQIAILLVYILAIAFLFSISYSACAVAVSRKVIPRSISSYFLVFFAASFPLSTIAMAAGYLTGTSRLPAVAALLPAALSLLSAIYLWTINSQSGEARSAMSCGIAVFSISLLAGVFVGADSREEGRLLRLKNLAEQERSIKIYRKNRDLEPDMPIWMLTGEGIYK